MMRQLRITIGRTALIVTVFDTPTGRAVSAAAPFESRLTTWPGEVYFPAPVHVGREDDARDVIEAGEIAFRTEGEAIVVAYGPTPCSEDSEIRLASPSNVWGRTDSDLSRLVELEAGDLVRVEPVDGAES